MGCDGDRTEAYPPRWRWTEGEMLLIFFFFSLIEEQFNVGLILSLKEWAGKALITKFRAFLLKSHTDFLSLRFSLGFWMCFLKGLLLIPNWIPNGANFLFTGCRFYNIASSLTGINVLKNNVSLLQCWEAGVIKGRHSIQMKSELNLMEEWIKVIRVLHFLN